MILADGRWQGMHGIGRFSHEILSRLKNCTVFTEGPAPLSLKNLAWQPHYLHKNKNKYNVYFNPGFNPILFSPMPFVFTIHDLIHLHIPGKIAYVKKVYYELLTKPATKKAFKIITVSEYSKNTLLEWTHLPEDKIQVVSNGISTEFQSKGKQHQPGYPYLLHTGNTKPHKNISRMIEAFSHAKIDSSFRLILTGIETAELKTIIHKHQLQNRIIFSGSLTNGTLAEYYRGAHAFLFPSLYEGFGIPVLEAMASGIPTLTSNTTSLPEVAGDAAILIDPYNIESITHGIEVITSNTTVRNELVQKGFERIALFSWDTSAKKIQTILDSA